MYDSHEVRQSRSLSSADSWNRIPKVSDRSSSLGRRTSPPTFHAHPSCARFAPNPQNTPYEKFPGQYVMPWNPPGPPFQNMPSPYHGYHPLEPYPPTQYFPFHQHQPQPYFQSPSSVQGANSAYQPAARFPPQFAASHPGPSHAPSFGGIQQYPSLYTPHVQPTAYYGPGPSVQTPFIDDQVQQHHPISYPHPNFYSTRRNSHAFSVQSTGSDALSSPSVAPSTGSTAVTSSRNTVSSPVSDPPRQHLTQRSLASTTAPHDRPSVRRQYHPKSPPSRSEWVMWMGNIPSDATHDELWRFLNHSGPRASAGQVSREVGENRAMSIFLISRSKCAFVNYQSEEQLKRAISQFNGRKLRPHDRRCPRLVCRVRRKEDDLQAGVGAQRGMGVHRRHVKNMQQKNGGSFPFGTASSKGRRSYPPTNELHSSNSNDASDDAPKSDVVEGTNHKVPTQSPSSYASTSSSFLTRHFPKRFFILKSLTRYDLDLSTERGVWATQKHNETTLDQAFRTSMEVILIFSVNKSGEFYGYARMASGISRGNHNVSWAPRAESLPSTLLPPTHRVPAHGSLQPHANSPYPRQMNTTPSELQFPEVFRTPFVNSSDENIVNQNGPNSSFVKSQEQWSMPPVLDTPPSSFSPDHYKWPQRSDPPSDFDPPSALPPESERYPGARAEEGSWVGAGRDHSDNHGPRLLPVTEEMYGESGVEEFQPSGSAMRSHSREVNWGAPFRIEWLCTERVQFHRTRHLRNPWNHGREVKVSRDGTELEPSVGQQLVDSWSSLAHEPANAARATRTPEKPGPSG